MDKFRLTDDEREVIRTKAAQGGIDSVILYVERLVAGRSSDAWDKGMRTGTSRAMRMMSDEPGLALASNADNPFLTTAGDLA